MKFFKKKGQVGPIGAIFLFIVFLIMMFIWLGSWISEVGQRAVSDNTLTGVEAFFFNNFAFVIIICMILGMIGWMYFANG